MIRLLITGVLLLACMGAAPPTLPYDMSPPKPGTIFHWDRYILRVVKVQDGAVWYASEIESKDWMDCMSLTRYRRIVREWPQPKKK
jgi:hypothetical protein